MIGIPYRLAALVLALTLSHGWAWSKGHSQANASRDAAEAVAERVRMAATMRNVRKAEAAPAPPPEDVVLLAEIRDLLKAKS